MTADLATLIQAFDLLEQQHIHHDLQPATTASLYLIEQTLELTIPHSVLHFVNQSQCAHNHIVGLGADNHHPNHILCVNKFLRRKRTRRKNGYWEPDLPKHYVIFNYGYELDFYYCFDTTRFNSHTQEYDIVRWRPNYVVSANDYIATNFNDFLQRWLWQAVDHLYHYNSRGQIRCAKPQLLAELSTLLELKIIT